MLVGVRGGGGDIMALVVCNAPLTYVNFLLQQDLTDLSWLFLAWSFYSHLQYETNVSRQI